MSPTGSVRSTYKAKDTEEFLDVIFYRPFGYVMALGARSLSLTPNQVTIISILVGVAAGHFFYYDRLALNLYGFVLLVLAEAMDSADGQLARMTNTKSQTGRILDGLSTGLWFFSIYLHLYFRMIHAGDSPFVLILIAISVISHSLQSAYADYFRNSYLMFVHGKSKSEIDDSRRLKEESRSGEWRKSLARRFLMWIYIHYTVEQEMFSKNLRKLHQLTKDRFLENIPEPFSAMYRALNQPLVKYFNILTTNTRMIFLFVALIIRRPLLYFLFELTVLNILLVAVVLKHEKNSRMIYARALELSAAENEERG